MINADGVAGSGGNSDLAKGGRSGSVKSVQVSDQDREGGQSLPLNGNVDIRGGFGGSGATGGGVGGALAAIRVTGDHMSLSGIAGAGGNATSKGGGGAGGSVTGTFLEGVGSVSTVDANGAIIQLNPTAQLVAGAGGDGAGALKGGGVGGSVQTASLRNDGDSVIRAGAGGSGQNSTGGVKGEYPAVEDPSSLPGSFPL